MITAGILLAAAVPAGATTKGLNQIITPDIQPEGVLSISYQQIDPNIGNKYETQLELGITPRFEIAAFQGFAPPEQILNAEYGIYQSKRYLLSTGFANWSSQGTAPQPYLEAGYLDKKFYGMAGTIRAIVEQPGVGGSVRSNHETQGILGAAYRLAPRVNLQLDYQTGAGNFATAGFTYNLTPQLSFNPAVYCANASGHAAYGYAVLTWNIQAFK
jgi:hypothetical protein